MTVNEQVSNLDPGADGYIRLDGITKTFDNGTVVAVENVDLNIGRDEFIVLLGPSGCGKTTTLRCIAGLETPDSGRIFIGEDDVTDTKPKGRDLAFVFQSIALFPHMTVRENMRFGLDMKTDLSADEKEERIQRAAGILGIPELLDRKPGALSGGQQQRVSLGRAMVIEPEAFLLDEPFSALDANLRDQMRVEVKKLQRELETSMIFVTHDQEEAMTLGDRIVVMNDANIMQIGSPNDIYNQPANLFVAGFIGSPSTNTLRGHISREGDDLVVETDLFSFPLSAEQARRYTGTEGRDVVLGIRPEYLHIDPAAALFSATLEVVESHGARDAVFLSAGDDEVTAVTNQGTVDAAHGDTVEVAVETEHAWLFDPDGTRLL